MPGNRRSSPLRAITLDLLPAYFALVIATGIISIAAAGVQFSRAFHAAVGRHALYLDDRIDLLPLLFLLFLAG